MKWPQVLTSEDGMESIDARRIAESIKGGGKRQPEVSVIARTSFGIQSLEAENLVIFRID